MKPNNSTEYCLDCNKSITNTKRNRHHLCRECYVARGLHRRGKKHKAQEYCWRCKPGCGIYIYCNSCRRIVESMEYAGYRYVERQKGLYF